MTLGRWMDNVYAGPSTAKTGSRSKPTCSALVACGCRCSSSSANRTGTGPLGALRGSTMLMNAVLDAFVSPAGRLGSALIVAPPRLWSAHGGAGPAVESSLRMSERTLSSTLIADVTLMSLLPHIGGGLNVALPVTFTV